MAPVRRHVSRLLRFATAWLALCASFGLTQLHAQPAAGPNSPLAPEVAGKTSTALPAATPATAAAQDRVIDIKLEGGARIKREQVLSNIGTRIDGPFDQGIFEKDIRKLTSKGWFVHVVPKKEYVPGGVIITLVVVERPTMQYVQFLGNKKIKRRTLAKETGLKKGDSFDPFAVQEAARKIEALYQSKGFNDVTVDVPEGTKHGDLGATFLIHEGKVQRFSDIEFVGNSPSIAPDGRLRTLIQSKKPILWVIKGKVDRKKIEEDVDKLTEYYREYGFFQATVSRKYSYNENEDKMVLTFYINEGTRSRVGDITFIGNDVYAQETFKENLKLKSGDYYDHHRMTNDMSMVKDLYGSNGYIFCDTVPDLRFDLDPGQVHVIYRVTEGQQYRIGDINVSIKGDNPHTRFATVMNRLSMRPGDIADIRQFRSSERRLKASGLFNTDPTKGDLPRVVFTPPDPAEEVARNKNRATGKPTGNPDTFRGQSPDPVPTYGGSRIAASPPRNSTSAYAPAGQNQWGGRPAGTPPAANYQSGNYQTGVPVKQAGYQAAAVSQGVSGTAQRQAIAAPVQALPRGQYPNSQYPNSQGRQATGSTEPGPLNQGTSSFLSGQSTGVRGQSPDPGYGGTAINGSSPGPGSLAASQSLANPQSITNPQSSYPGRQVNALQPPPTTNYSYAPGYGEAPPAGGYSQPGYPPAGGINGGGPLLPPQGPPSVAAPPGSFLNGSPEEVPQLPTVPIDVYASEAQTGRFMLGAGVNSNAGLVGSIILDEQNFDWRRWPTSWEDFRSGRAFRGAGQKFRLEAAPGTVVQRYLFNFAEPYLFDTPVSFGLSGYYFNRYYRDWMEQRLGGRATLGYQFTPDLSGNVGIRAEDVVIGQPRVAGVPDLEAVLGHSSLFSGSASLSHDTRDSTFLPTEGHYITSTFEYFFGTFQYPKVSINSQKHFLLKERPDGTGRHTLSLYNQTGFAGSDTPIYERFYAGGFSTLRGFQFRGASPQVDTVLVGGDFQFLNSVEYMLPITADDMLKMVAFVDFGTVETDIAINWDQFRIAPGLGIRVTIPMISPAPIAIDFAVPVQHAPGDLLQNVQFFVGVGR